MLIFTTIFLKGAPNLSFFIGVSWRSGACGGEFTDNSGQLTTPNHPNNYPNNKNCIWKITVPDNAQVSLKFHVFKVRTKIVNLINDP